MLIKILICLVVVFAGMAIFVATRPPEFSVQRSVVIQAPAEKIYPYIHDLRAWESWSPWLKKDSTMKMTYQGPSKGPGASMTWKGNSESGEGTMTILSETPNRSVALRLDFLKPMQSTHPSEFSLKPEGNHTTVTWKMTGEINFIGKAMCLFMDIDKAIGPDFENGLASIKQLSESETP